MRFNKFVEGMKFLMLCISRAMSSCQPSDSNLPLYFQNICPTISNTSFQNQILYATTGSIPSYIPLNRIWNFICCGRFEGSQVSVIFDASNLIQECPQYIIRFDGHKRSIHDQ